MDIRQLHRDLIELHAPSKTYSEDGVRQLLTTILSQNVADVQTARASEALFAAYPDYRAMETADHDELAEVDLRGWVDEPEGNAHPTIAGGDPRGNRRRVHAGVSR